MHLLTNKLLFITSSYNVELHTQNKCTMFKFNISVNIKFHTFAIVSVVMIRVLMMKKQSTTLQIDITNKQDTN